MDDKSILNNERFENESFEDYKKRRRTANKLLRMYKKGRPVNGKQ